MSFLPSVHKFGSAEGSWELLYHNLRFPVQFFSFLWPTGQISLQFRQIRTGSGSIRCGLHKRNGLFHHLRDHLCHFFCGNARCIVNSNGGCIVFVLPYRKAHTTVVPLHGDFHIVALREIIVVSRYLWQCSQQPLHDFPQDFFPPQPQEPWRRICHTAKIAQTATSASRI